MNRKIRAENEKRRAHLRHVGKIAVSGADMASQKRTARQFRGNTSAPVDDEGRAGISPGGSGGIALENAVDPEPRRL